MISAWSQTLCILLLRRNIKVFICIKFRKLFVYAVLQHRSQAAILVLLVPPHFSLLDLAILSSLLYLLFPGDFSEYIRHTWQHSILLDQTSNMNFATSRRLPGARIGKIMFPILVLHQFTMFSFHILVISLHVHITQGYDRATL